LYNRRVHRLKGLTLLLLLLPSTAAPTGGPALRYTVAEGSEVRYRVREQLAGLSFPNDAVGSTAVVEGQVVFEPPGRIVTGESRFIVDLRTLKSDEPRRDSYIRRNTLETDPYPTVVFVPVEVRGLPFPHPSSGSFPCQLVGDLAVRDATRQVTWEATASFAAERVTVRAVTGFRFDDFGMRIPRVAVVLSVENSIRLEADLVLRRGS
jgi:polyisoprenoid-binding protein YceI